MDASSPAIDQNGFLYLGDVIGKLHKFQENVQGTVTFPTRLWKVPIGTKITASPVIGSDGTVYVGSTNGLSAVRPSDGKVLWNFPAGIVDQTPALGSDDTVYFGVKSGAVQGNLRRRTRRNAAVAIRPGPRRVALRRVPHRRRGRDRVRRVRHQRPRVLAGWRVAVELRYRQRRLLVPGHRGNGEHANRWQRRDLRRLPRLEAPCNLEPAARERLQRSAHGERRARPDGPRRSRRAVQRVRERPEPRRPVVRLGLRRRQVRLRADGIPRVRRGRDLHRDLDRQ